MKAEELMIGDCVMLDGEPKQITGIYKHSCKSGYVQIGTIDCSAEYLKPIPLTAEILEKNGFVSQKESYIAKQYIYACGGGPDHNLFVTVFKNRDFVKVYYYPIDTITMIDVNIPHCAVHQLQHALRLCGIEKEITL